MSYSIVSQSSDVQNSLSNATEPVTFRIYPTKIPMDVLLAKSVSCPSTEFCKEPVLVNKENAKEVLNHDYTHWLMLNGERKQGNSVILAYCVVIDYDNDIRDPSLKEKLIAAIEKTGVKAVLVTTKRHLVPPNDDIPGYPRYRAFFPLSGCLETQHVIRLTKYLIDMIGIKADECCLQPSRAWRGHQDNQNFEWVEIPGSRFVKTNMIPDEFVYSGDQKKQTRNKKQSVGGDVAVCETMSGILEELKKLGCKSHDEFNQHEKIRDIALRALELARWEIVSDSPNGTTLTRPGKEKGKVSASLGNSGLTCFSTTAKKIFEVTAANGFLTFFDTIAYLCYADGSREEKCGVLAKAVFPKRTNDICEEFMTYLDGFDLVFDNSGEYACDIKSGKNGHYSRTIIVNGEYYKWCWRKKRYFNVKDSSMYKHATLFINDLLLKKTAFPPKWILNDVSNYLQLVDKTRDTSVRRHDRGLAETFNIFRQDPPKNDDFRQESTTWFFKNVGLSVSMSQMDVLAENEAENFRQDLLTKIDKDDTWFVPSNYSFNLLDLNENHETPYFDSILGNMFQGDSATIEIFKKSLGYLLFEKRLNKQQISFVCGGTGTGKSMIYSHVIPALAEKCFFLSRQALTDQFGMMDLQDATCAICDDKKFNKRELDSAFELMKALKNRHKVRKPYSKEYENIVFRANGAYISNLIPKFDDGANALRSRGIFFDVTGKDMRKSPDGNKVFNGVMGELDKIGTKLFQYYLKLQTENKGMIPQPESAKELIRSMEGQSCVVLDFLRECYTINKGKKNKISSGHIFKQFQLWAKNAGILHILDRSEFRQQLRNEISRISQMPECENVGYDSKEGRIIGMIPNSYQSEASLRFAAQIEESALTGEISTTKHTNITGVSYEDTLEEIFPSPEDDPRLAVDPDVLCGEGNRIVGTWNDPTAPPTEEDSDLFASKGIVWDDFRQNFEKAAKVKEITYDRCKDSNGCWINRFCFGEENETYFFDLKMTGKDQYGMFDLGCTRSWNGFTILEKYNPWKIIAVLLYGDDQPQDIERAKDTLLVRHESHKRKYTPHVPH